MPADIKPGSWTFRRPDGGGSGQFAESALDTLYVARNRGTGKPALSRTRVGGLREWERALRPFGVSLSIAIQKISIMDFSYDAEAKHKGFDLRRFTVPIVREAQARIISAQIASRLWLKSSIHPSLSIQRNIARFLSLVSASVSLPTQPYRPTK
jgi:hypothetical protein